MHNDLITTREAADLARVHLTTLHRWLHAGQLRVWKRGRRMMVRRADVLALFREIEPPHGSPAWFAARAEGGRG